MDLQLTGRGYLVTGASGGIGLATARRLSAEGARVAMLDIDESRLSSAVEAVRSITDATVIAAPADITDETRVRDAVDAAAAALGGLHGVAHCAGANSDKDGAAGDVAGSEFVRLVHVNLVGSFHVAKYALPHLIAAGGGTIANVASAGALPGVKVGGATAYNASKAGVLALTRSLASQYADRNIRSVAVCPGPIETPMLADAIKKLGDEIFAARTLRRVGQPEEVAALLAYLLSDLGSFVSGSTWGIDGNLTGY